MDDVIGNLKSVMRVYRQYSTDRITQGVINQEALRQIHF